MRAKLLFLDVQALTVDRCPVEVFASVEVFAQDGALGGAALIFPSEDSRGIALVGDGARIIRGAIYPPGCSSR